MNDKFFVLLFLGLLLGPGNIAFTYEVGRSIVYQDDSEGSDGDGSAGCCCCFLELGIFTIILGLIATSPIWLSILTFVIIFLFALGVLILIGRDAKKQNLKYPYLWALLVMITGPVGLLLYFLITRNMKKKEKEEKWD